MSLPTNDTEKRSFELNEKQKNDKGETNNLNELFTKLKNEINENQKEINELKNLIKAQNNEINSLKEEIKPWLKYGESKEILELKNSLIIHNNIEYNISIKNWINPDIKIQGELLYRLSRDGDQISTFHSLCDNKGPTLTLFETKEGHKGGIYTPLSWDTNSNWKHDMKSFMFNLNKNQKYKKLKSDKSIYCKNSEGPWTNSFGFEQSNQMRKIQHDGKYINLYYMNGAEILPNNNKDTKYFDVKEVEIYKIMI